MAVQTPLRRGAAIVATTGGALSLVGVASSPAPAVEPVAQALPAETDSVALRPSVEPVTQALPVESDGVALRPSVEPVEPEPDVVDVAALVKAVQLTEQETARLADERAAQERAAEEQQRAEAEAAARGPVDCGLNTSGLGRVKSHVRTAAEALGCRFGEPTMHGVAGRAGTSDHPLGLAVDFMVKGATGDALAACALENQDALGVKYVIWEQQINHGNGWKPMEDRGSVTANHFDHVHISFTSGGGDGTLRGC